ncbi:MAG: toxin-activating lysine-acyltransferase [Pseudomonadota bacterium]
MTFNPDIIQVAYLRGMTDLAPTLSAPGGARAQTLAKAWEKITAIAHDALPALSNEIIAIRDGEGPTVIAKSRDAMNSVTILERSDQTPRIFVSFDGSPRAVLTLAHEFGHALHLSFAAAQQLNCRLVQEACAFLMELIVITSWSKSSPSEALELEEGFREEFQFYGHESAKKLAKNDFQILPEVYETVYPVAMHAAMTLHSHRMDLAAALYRGLVDANALEAHLGDVHARWQSVLPPRLPATSAPDVVFDPNCGRQRHYAFMGLKASLDLLQDDILMQSSISRYVAYLAAQSRDGTTRFIFDQDGAVRGYKALARPAVADARPLAEGHNPSRLCNPWLIDRAQLSMTGALSLSNMMHGFSIGACLYLLSRSAYHRGLRVGPYLRKHVLPALEAGQIRIWQQKGHPVGFVSWRYIDDRTKAALQGGDTECLETAEALPWNFGQHLFFNDLVFPDASISEAMSILKHDQFAHETCAYAIRRYASGKTRFIRFHRPDDKAAKTR